LPQVPPQVLASSHAIVCGAARANVTRHSSRRLSQHQFPEDAASPSTHKKRERDRDTMHHPHGFPSTTDQNVESAPQPIDGGPMHHPGPTFPFDPAQRRAWPHPNQPYEPIPHQMGHVPGANDTYSSQYQPYHETTHLQPHFEAQTTFPQDSLRGQSMAQTVNRTPLYFGNQFGVPEYQVMPTRPEDFAYPAGIPPQTLKRMLSPFSTPLRQDPREIPRLNEAMLQQLLNQLKMTAIASNDTPQLEKKKTITRTGTFREKEKTAGENKNLEERKKTTTTRRKDSTTDEEEEEDRIRQDARRKKREMERRKKEEEREKKEKEAQEQKKQRLRKKLLDAIVAKEDLRADIEELSATLKSTAEEIRGILQEDEQLLMTNGAVSLNVTLTICRGHLTSKGCVEETCQSLHICPKFPFGLCADALCENGHSISTRHNRHVLNELNLENVDP
ncbi:unnamed protein product, partial [Darwinula stevensoni]